MKSNKKSNTLAAQRGTSDKLTPETDAQVLNSNSKKGYVTLISIANDDKVTVISRKYWSVRVTPRNDKTSGETGNGKPQVRKYTTKSLKTTKESEQVVKGSPASLFDKTRIAKAATTKTDVSPPKPKVSLSQPRNKKLTHAQEQPAAPTKSGATISSSKEKPTANQQRLKANFSDKNVLDLPVLVSRGPVVCYMQGKGQTLPSSGRKKDESAQQQMKSIIECCSVCFDNKAISSIISVDGCHHKICKECIIQYVATCPSAMLPCPVTECTRQIPHFQIRHVLPEAVWEAFLTRSLKLAEARTSNTFHCQTPDCPGWCVVAPGYTGKFLCPICSSSNCVKCGKIHHTAKCPKPSKLFLWQTRRNMSHKEFISRMEVKSKEAVKKKIRQRQAMACPGCGCAVQKQGGCKHLTCSMCRTAFNWKPGSFSGHRV